MDFDDTPVPVTDSGHDADQEEARDRLTREALTDVDAERVVDHRTVRAWADSLGTDEPLPVPRR